MGKWSIFNNNYTFDSFDVRCWRSDDDSLVISLPFLGYRGKQRSKSDKFYKVTTDEELATDNDTLDTNCELQMLSIAKNWWNNNDSNEYWKWVIHEYGNVESSNRTQYRFYEAMVAGGMLSQSWDANEFNELFGIVLYLYITPWVAEVERWSRSRINGIITLEILDYIAPFKARKLHDILTHLNNNCGYDVEEFTVKMLLSKLKKRGILSQYTSMYKELYYTIPDTVSKDVDGWYIVEDKL